MVVDTRLAFLFAPAMEEAAPPIIACILTDLPQPNQLQKSLKVPTSLKPCSSCLRLMSHCSTADWILTWKRKGQMVSDAKRWGKENQIQWQLFLSGRNRRAGSRNFPTLVTIHLLTKHPVTLKIAILFRCISVSSTYPGQSVGRLVGPSHFHVLWMIYQ